MILGTKNRFKRFQDKKFSGTYPPELQYKNTRCKTDIYFSKLRVRVGGTLEIRRRRRIEKI